MTAERLPAIEQFDAEPYTARIERGDRFGWWITFRQGWATIERDIGWWSPTRKRAELKACRLIARWTAQDRRRAASARTITPALPVGDET